MQDQYAFDIGDFGKCGLLRRVTEDRRLGVVWYRVPNGGNQDGKYTQYLSDDKRNQYKRCDEDLFNRFRAAFQMGIRSVAAISTATILPETTVYFPDQLDFRHILQPANTRRGKDERLALRSSWVRRASEAVQQCDIVFLDPDNGLEVPSCLSYYTKGPKFAFKNELKTFLKTAKLVVLYHHLNRHKKYGTHERQMHDRSAELREALNVRVLHVRFAPYSPRAFFLMTRCEAEFERAREILNCMLAGDWGRYFDEPI